jgi:hypothetical protein
MYDAMRRHFANPPPGSKLQAAIDFGVDTFLRIKRRLNRLKDQLALPEIEALIEIRDLRPGQS